MSHSPGPSGSATGKVYSVSIVYSSSDDFYIMNFMFFLSFVPCFMCLCHTCIKVSTSYLLTSVLFYSDSVQVAARAPVGSGLDHLGGQSSESLVDVLGKHLVRPVEVEHERLQGLQLPQHVLRRRAPVTAHAQTHTHTNVRQTRQKR